MELIDVFDVNSVAVALITSIINKVISFLSDIKALSLSPMKWDKPELFFVLSDKIN